MICTEQERCTHRRKAQYLFGNMVCFEVILEFSDISQEYSQVQFLTICNLAVEHSAPSMGHLMPP